MVKNARDIDHAPRPPFKPGYGERNAKEDDVGHAFPPFLEMSAIFELPSERSSRKQRWESGWDRRDKTRYDIKSTRLAQPCILLTT